MSTPCECRLCIRLRAIERIAAMLPAAERTELVGIFADMNESEEKSEWRIAELEKKRQKNED